MTTSQESLPPLSTMPSDKLGGFWIRFTALLIDWTLAIFIVPTFVNFYYYFTAGTTIGYKMMGLKIVSSMTGNKPSVLNLLGRWFAKILSILPLYMGYVSIAVSAKKQGFHDKLAQTYVYRATKPKWILGLSIIIIGISLICIIKLSS